MVQLRRQTHNPSPPPRPIPVLPNPIRLYPPLPSSSSSTSIRRAQSLQLSSIQTTQQEPFHINQNVPQTNGFSNSIEPKYDPLTDIITNPITTNNNENYDQSYIISSLLNQTIPRRDSTKVYPFPSQPKLIIYESKTEESTNIPPLINDDGLPVVSVDKNRLPVFARFPFDVSFIPQTMDTNVEDNIHKLRLRLIDSELNYQRQSASDYLKRTQNQVSLLSPKPIDYYTRNVRPPTNLTYQRATPKIFSRQGSYSPLIVDTSMTRATLSGLSRDRIGMEGDPQGNMDIERDLEIRRIQDSLNSGRRSNLQPIISNYSYDPRLHLQPLAEEQQYVSSNMDDLIDAMARRHLASRRLDTAIDQQRRSAVGYGPYEYSILGRRASVRSQQRSDDLYLTTGVPMNFVEPDFLRTNPIDFNPMSRSRSDYYNRFRPSLNGLNTTSVVRTTSFSKLPPISPGIDSQRLSRAQIPTNSALYQAKYDSPSHRSYHQTLPLNVPDNNEHLIELPSDIFTSRTVNPLGSSEQHHRGRKSRHRPISKDKSDISADSDYEQSDNEKNKSSMVNRHKQIQENHDQGFFTEEPPRGPKFYRNLFRKAARGIYFVYILKYRAAKSRLNRPSQTLSATIHKIRLQEIMVALHRVYLEPDGPIYNALIQTISNSIDLKDALNSQTKFYTEAIQAIGEALKNIISKIIDFMPKDGVLGTAKTSAIASLIQDGNPFPENYFWQCEKEMLEFNQSKIINITKQRAILLLIDVFIFRGLVTTLLMKPIKYRLILGQLSTTQSSSLKVLASVLLYIGRRVAKTNPQILALPHELEFSLHSDADIQSIVEHAEIKSIISTCELSLRVWCEEYIRRIDESFARELRT